MFDLHKSAMEPLGLIGVISSVVALVITCASLALKARARYEFALWALLAAVGHHFYGIAWLAVPFTLFGLILGVFIFLTPAPKREGRKLLDQIEGFRLYLAKAEHDSLKRLSVQYKTPQLYEQLLPFAIALNLETKWSDQFSEELSIVGTRGENHDSKSYYSWYSGGGFDISNSFAPTR